MKPLNTQIAAPQAPLYRRALSPVYRFYQTVFFWRRDDLTPINKRRLQNFRANKRGYWSLVIFSVLFFLTLFSEFIANDKPLMVSYNGSWHFPVVKFYPETSFGGEFETEAVYRRHDVECLIRTGGNETCYDDPRTTEIAEGQQAGWVLWPLIRYSYSTVNDFIPTAAPSAPWWTFEEGNLCEVFDGGDQNRHCTLGNFHWLGTDDNGRDVLARVLYGFRISVLFGLILTILSSVIGVAAGAVQGYFGGWVDLIFQRVIELWSSIPQLFVLLIVAAALVPGFWTLLGIMMLFSWITLVGVVRAEFLRARNLEYVKAARSLGLSNAKIMFRHLLPNAMVATITMLPFILSGALTTLTSLDFLGLGLPPGSPSLGELIKQGKENIEAPWLAITAFIVISLMLSLLIFIGEAVRDAFDPRKTFK